MFHDLPYIIGVVGSVCAAFVVYVVMRQRIEETRKRGAIRLMGHLRLDVRRWLYLVRVGDRAFVVATGDGVFTKLGELPVSEVEKTSETMGVER